MLTSPHDPSEGYRDMTLPIMVLSCKADLPHEVEPNDAVEMLKRYDTGLIEVSSTTNQGKERMDQSFRYLLRAILRQRGGLVACSLNPLPVLLLIYIKYQALTASLMAEILQLPTFHSMGRRGQSHQTIPQLARLQYPPQLSSLPWMLIPMHPQTLLILPQLWILWRRHLYLG